MRKYTPHKKQEHNFLSVAIYHWDCSIIKRSSGSSSVASAAYRSGEKILDEKTGITHDFTKKKGVLHTEIITPDNVPDWAKNRHQLWNAVEAAEKRKDSQLAREIMVALPNELTEAQRLELVRNYITEQFTTKGIIADLAIHAPNRKGDNRNYHAHILLTMRKITAEGFGNKERAWNAKANIYQWREQWQHHTNRMLREAGLDCQIDGRSHAKKGLDKEPLLHLGVHATALERKGIKTELGNENRAIESRNKLREKLRYQLEEINKEINKLLPEKNEIQLSDDNSLNAEKDKSFETQQTKTDLSNQVGKQQEITERPSLEERKKAIEQTAEAFNVQQEKLKLQIENAADEKTQDRLRLKAELDNANFIVDYNKVLVAILTEQDQKKNANEINELKYQIRKSERTYKKQADEWSMCAIRDNDYEPLDEKSALKIEKIKAREQKSWARFEDKALNNDWSSDKIAREKQRLIEELDIALRNEFGLDLDYGLEL